MANLSLRIKADFDEAARQFKALAEESDLTSLRLKNFGKALGDEHVDKFIARQELAAVAMQATGRETEGLNSQVSAYQREIERLIKSGLDPQDEFIQRLQEEYISLKEKQEAARQATEAETAAAKAHAAALDNSAKETIELLNASSDHERQSIRLRREQADLKEEIERLIKRGLSPNSEEVQRLAGEYHNLQTRIEKSERAQERKTKALQAATTALKASAAAVAGLAAGAVALAKRNANLANGIANSARIVGMTTETFQELNYAMRMSGIQNGEYMLNRLNRSVIDVRNETGELTKFLENNYHQLLEQLQGVESNEEAFHLLMDAIHRAPNEFAAAELAMAAFGRNGAQMVLAAQNGAEGINALREEARQLGVVSNENAQAAIQFNDAMHRLRTAAQGIAQELTSQLLPTLTNIVVRATNAVQRFGEFRDRLQSALSVVRVFIPYVAKAAVGVTAFVTALKAAKYVTLFINKMKTLITVLDNLRRVATAAKVAKAALIGIKTAGMGTVAAIGFATAAAAAATTALARAFRSSSDELRELDVTMNNINFPAFSHMAEEIKDLDVALTQLSWGGAAAAAEATETANGEIKKSLRDRLNTIALTENQIKNEQINTIKSFLIQRAQLESNDMERQIAFLREKQEYLLTSYALYGDERIAVEQAVQNAIQTLQTETAEKAEESSKNMLRAYSVFFGGFSKLLSVAGRENRAFFVASRLMAIVQAGINTSLAITKALASMPPPMSIVKAVGIGMKGTAQKAKIVNSMIPSAETGGRFIVPNATSRVDGVGLRVNPNERVDITPAGQAGSADSVIRIVLKMSDQVLWDSMNRGARAGELHEFEMAGNL